MAAVVMKFAFIFALLLCTSCLDIGDQNDGASSCNPINVNVHGNANIKESIKPSAHIEAANKRAVTYQGNHVIKDWSTSAPYSHLAGGMTYNDGKLTVPTPGRYYIYAQLYYHSNGRVHVYVNNKVITMIQPPTAGSDHGTLYAGGVFNLKAGDVISLIPSSSITIFMYSFHSYFGAFLI